jgi:putative DNA primase/helicase
MKKLSLTFPEAIETVVGLIGAVSKHTKPKEKTVTPEIMRKIFVESAPVAPGDSVDTYLKSRGLTNIPTTLRYSYKCWESETKQNQKAMLAVFTGADNVAVTMHRTYLDVDASKLKIKSPKKILPPLKKMPGGAVRLFPLDGDTLIIAEGIETAIAGAEDFGVPAWAALSATLMEAFEPPLQVKNLIILADNDRNYRGQKAAYSLANKVKGKGEIETTVYVPEKVGTDWLDVVSGKQTNSHEKTTYQLSAKTS